MSAQGWSFSVGLDLFPLAAAMLAALSCALLGNFLVLRRLSLMGDAISHSVLPGLVAAYLITANRGSLAMFLGAGAAGVATVVLVEAVKRLGRIEPGAAMGVVFSVLFALGVVLIERAALRHIDLDADCVLHGQLETLAWYDAPDRAADALRWSTLEHVPRQVRTLAGVALVAAAFVSLFFKELRIAAFDPGLATALGFNATAMHYALMVLVAGATVAAFEAVGSILVIAMLICPAATARLLTDRMGPQVVVSAALALAAALAGYIGASWVPGLWERDSVNAAGSITVVSGAILALAVVASPRHGVVARSLRQRRLARRVLRDDLLGALYRAHEAGEADVQTARLADAFPHRAVRPALAAAVRHGQVRMQSGRASLTERGRLDAAALVRSHRLWEHYLVSEAGLAPDHVHTTAEQLEHLDARPPEGARTDPHGRPIP
jgi:manganese/zinc/iron transport system permease protein